MRRSTIQDIYSVTFFISAPTVRGVSAYLTEMMLGKQWKFFYSTKQFAVWRELAVSKHQKTAWHHLQTDD